MPSRHLNFYLLHKSNDSKYTGLEVEPCVERLSVYMNAKLATIGLL